MELPGIIVNLEMVGFHELTDLLQDLVFPLVSVGGFDGLVLVLSLIHI